jgi:hypothetical protein
VNVLGELLVLPLSPVAVVVSVLVLSAPALMSCGAVRSG